MEEINKENKIRKVGFFLGSFDPIHNGHVSAIRTILEKGLVDRVVIVPAPKNPWKKHDPVNLGLRYWMCMEVAKMIPGVSVETGTNGLWDDSKILFSYQQLGEILKKRQHLIEDRYIIAGTDIVDDIKCWKNGDWILENFKILKVRRTKDSISSTMIRENIEKAGDLVPKGVYNIIIKNKLYTKQ